MSKKKILCLFDFCDTIVNGQSISLFLDFMYQNSSFMKKVQIKIRRRMNPYSSIESKKYKEYLLNSYLGISKKEFERLSLMFVKTVLQKKFIRTLLKD